MILLVKIIGVLLVVIAFVLVFRSIKIYDGTITPTIKRYLLLTFVALPFMIAFVANYHVFERSKTVESCMDCHVMRPLGNDMKNPASMTLAARHYKHGWIQKKQCYSCHKDYGLNGTLKAKMDGYRHLAKYVTGTYEEPIKFRGDFNYNNCLSCHEGTEKFINVKVHVPLFAKFKANEMSCLNCHGSVHPTRTERTPGHENYKALIKEFIK